MNRRLTILVVEDGEDDVALLKNALRDTNVLNPIQVCRDGEEALCYLKAQGPYADRARFPFPSVIFLDLKLPKLSGFEVLNWLQAHTECSVVPVIVLTASVLEDDVQRAYRLGANAYMEKPNSFDEFREMIRITVGFWSLCIKPSLPGRC